MSNFIRSMREAELAPMIEVLLKNKLGLQRINNQLTIGKYRLDYVAINQQGELVVVELKVSMRKEALAQLLLYPHALKKALIRTGCNVK